MFGIAVPDIGPVQASWQEVDHNDIIGVDKVKFMAGDGKTFRLTATGRVESVIKHNQAFVDGLDLQLAVRAANTDNLLKLLGMRFPDLGAVDGRLALSGGKDKLTAEDLLLTVKSAQGLDLVAKGRVGYIGLEKAMPIRDIDVRLTAQAPKITVLPVFGKLNLPELGAFQASARVRDHEGALNVETFKLRTGPEDFAAFRMGGQARHIRSRERMNLAADFEVDSTPWLKKKPLF